MQKKIHKILKVLEIILIPILLTGVVIIILHSIFYKNENPISNWLIRVGFICYFIIYFVNLHFKTSKTHERDNNNEIITVDTALLLYEQLLSKLDFNIIIVDKNTKNILLTSPKTTSFFKIRSLIGKNIDNVLNSFFLGLSIDKIIEMINENVHSHKLKTDNNSSYELIFHELCLDKILEQSKDEVKNIDSAEYILIDIYDTSNKEKINLSESNFISDVSHEIKTPLTIIKAYTETLLLNDLDKEKRTEFLNIINAETDVAKLLISKIIRLTNLDYGLEQPEFENCDVVRLVKEECDRIGFLALEKDISVVFHVDKEKEYIISLDKEMIKTVIKNLVLNAIIYTNNNGRIDIYITDMPNHVEIVVSDNGIGLSAEDLLRIFDRFYTVSKSRHKDYEKFGHSGTGLGLPLVKRIIDLHKGKISVESELNQGSSFKISLNKAKIDSN